LEIAKLILEYLKALIWPTAALIVALVYKNEFTSILGRLKKAGLPGGVSLDFSEEVREVRQLSEQAEPVQQERKDRPSIPLTDANARMISVGLQPSPSGLNMEYYTKLALQDPNIALAGLRIEIDILAKNLAKGFGVKIDQRESGIRLLKRLMDRGAITKSQYDLGEKILRLCDAAVHGSTVSREQAEAVIDSAKVLGEQYLAWLSWGFSDGWKPAGTAGK
jgi:hypothetical protein